MNDANQLYGTWKLVRCTSRIVETGETEDLFGKAPKGFINYGRDGRMMVLVVHEKRPSPADLASLTDGMRAELLKSMVAYAGTFTFDGKAVTHHIDVSWNELWTGTSPVRNVKLDGRRLTLSTNPEPGLNNGRLTVSVLEWEKVDGG